jgi:CRP/FNR family transcriptional regulator
VELQKSAIHTDLDLLTRLKSLSFLSAVEMRGLANSLHSTYFRKGEVIFDQKALTAGVHILLAGAAKITCLNRGGERVVVTLLAPGPMPEFFSSPVTRWQFRCEAYRDCRVGQVSWDQFDAITKAVSPSALRTFHENNLKQWYRWSLGFLGLDVRERLLFTLRQLCSNFGVMESRGSLFRIVVSHRDLADLVGASRPRITEQLAELERKHLIVRQGRQLIVCQDKIDNSTGAPGSDSGRSFGKVPAGTPFPEERQCIPRFSPEAASAA